MNNIHSKWWLIAVLFFLYTSVFSQKYSIHLAAFTEEIEPSFFHFAGFNEVHHQEKSLNFHQYSWGNFSNLETAKKQLTSLQKKSFLKGFSNLSVLSISTDYIIPTTDSNIENEVNLTDFQLFSRSVYVQSSSKSIQKMDVATLEEVSTILKNYPTLKLRIILPENLKKPFHSTNSTEVVKHFLLAQNIPAYRIKTISNSTNDTTSSKETTSNRKQQVIMTLVDVKEEIVLDNFGNNGLIVRQISDNSIQVLD